MESLTEALEAELGQIHGLYDFYKDIGGVQTLGQIAQSVKELNLPWHKERNELWYLDKLTTAMIHLN
jgi:hypothetical protein